MIVTSSHEVTMMSRGGIISSMKRGKLAQVCGFGTLTDVRAPSKFKMR